MRWHKKARPKKRSLNRIKCKAVKSLITNAVLNEREYNSEMDCKIHFKVFQFTIQFH